MRLQEELISCEICHKIVQSKHLFSMCIFTVAAVYIIIRDILYGREKKPLNPIQNELFRPRFLAFFGREGGRG